MTSSSPRAGSSTAASSPMPTATPGGRRRRARGCASMSARSPASATVVSGKKRTPLCRVGRSMNLLSRWSHCRAALQASSPRRHAHHAASRLTLLRTSAQATLRIHHAQSREVDTSARRAFRQWAGAAGVDDARRRSARARRHGPATRPSPLESWRARNSSSAMLSAAMHGDAHRVADVASSRPTSSMLLIHERRDVARRTSGRARC